MATKTKKKTVAKSPAPKSVETALVLRACDSNLRSYNGFQWPDKGIVEAPDWSPEPCCGQGLHGWLFGQGDHSAATIQADSKWLVVRVAMADMIDLGGKVKFPRGEVFFVGDKKAATDYLRASEPRSANVAVIGAHVAVGDEATAAVGAFGTATAGAFGTATAGDSGTATAGYSGTATAGAFGTATAGYSGTATAGDSGTATAGDSGTATAGDRGTATAGYRGTATAGYSGTATAGDSGTATAGYSGTATAGYSGTATAGYSGTATAGYRGTATAGDSGTATAGAFGTATAGAFGTATAGYSGTATAGELGELRIRYWDNKADRYRTRIAYVGEDGIKPNTPYRLNDKNEFVEVK